MVGGYSSDVSYANVRAIARDLFSVLFCCMSLHVTFPHAALVMYKQAKANLFA